MRKIRRNIKKRAVAIFLIAALCLNPIQIVHANEIPEDVSYGTIDEMMSEDYELESDAENQPGPEEDAENQPEPEEDAGNQPELEEEVENQPELEEETDSQPEPEEKDEEQSELEKKTEEQLESQEESENLSETENQKKTSDISFDSQPNSLQEVQDKIDQWQKTGVKPRWEFEVDEELIPAGYYCDVLVDDQNDTEYWTIFTFERMLARSATILVGDFKTLKSTLENLDSSDTTVIQLTDDITATDNIGTGTSRNPYIKGNFVIDGQGVYKIDMGNYQFRLGGTEQNPYHFTIANTELIQKSSGAASIALYGVFCICEGSYSKDYKWNADFNQVTFRGTALVGTNNQDTYTSGVKRKFEYVRFEDVDIHVGGGWRGYNAVVFAENINIAGTFEMHSAEVLGGICGSTHPTYQRYFKSPGTGHEATDWQSTTSTVANGAFTVESGAQVNMTRDPGYGIDHWGNTGGGDYGDSTAYYRSLIMNYEDFIFEDGSDFYAKAGTNRIVYGSGLGTEHANLQRRTAVIKSNNAKSFQVLGNASVKLEADYQNAFNSSSITAAARDLKGFTVLSLRKTGDLAIDIEGSLNLVGGNLGSQKGTFADARSTAPAVIWGPGASTTTITGMLDIESNTPNAWYYQYATSKNTGKQTFIVDGNNAKANIIGNNDGHKGANEYAAFEAYGTYDVDIQVLNGAVMKVESNGYRGMSLASAGTYNKKNIVVDGAGSQLDITGVHWAIAAEGQPVLGIQAINGGIINLATSGEVGDGYDKAGAAPSTVYSVGPATFKTKGDGSQINVYHSGGTYSAIFHDGYGALTIDVSEGAAMNVESHNSGTNIDARRAAITVQNPGAGSKGDLYGSIIRVDGQGSSLSVLAHNTDIHSGSYGVQQFSMGAISFGGYADLGGGKIEITGGGNFSAVSNSLCPTIFLNTGTITFDNPGEYEIRNDSTRNTIPTYKNYNIKPYSGDAKDYATVGQAIYIGEASKTLKANLSLTQNVAFFNDCDIIAWQVGKNHSDYDGGGYQDSQINTYWEDVSVAAGIAGYATASGLGRIVTPTANVLGRWTTSAESVDAAGNQYTTKFILPAYGRIVGTGSGYNGQQAEGSITKEASVTQIEAGSAYTYRITAANTGTAVWTGVQAIDDLSGSPIKYTGNYQVLSGDGVSVTGSVDEVVLHFGDIAPGTEKVVDIEVQVDVAAQSGTIITNVVVTNDGVEGEDNVKPEVITVQGDISKTADTSTVQRGQIYNYAVKVHNLGSVVWTDVEVVDDLSINPIRYTGNYQAAAGSGISVSEVSEQVTITFGDILPGEEKIVIIEMQVEEYADIGAEIVNKVITNDGKEAEDTIRPVVMEADGKIKKWADVYGHQVSRGETYTYTISAGNFGNADWENVVAVDDLAGKPIRYTGNYNLVNENIIVSQNGDKVFIDFGDILPGQEKTVQIEVRVVDDAPLGVVIKNKVVISEDIWGEDYVNPEVTK